jgi:hypothetical protein
LNLYRQLGCNTPVLWTQASERLKSTLVRSALISDLLNAFPIQLQEFRKNKKFRTLLRYRRTGLLIAVVTARHPRGKDSDCWVVDVPKGERKRTAVVAFLNRTNDTVESLRVFNRLRYSRLTVRPGRNGEWLNSGYTLDKLEDLLTVLERVRGANVFSHSGSVNSTGLAVIL